MFNKIIENFQLKYLNWKTRLIKIEKSLRILKYKSRLQFSLLEERVNHFLKNNDYKYFNNDFINNNQLIVITIFTLMIMLLIIMLLMLLITIIMLYLEK